MSNFKQINLEKGMYQCGNLSDVLEELDSSEDYYGTTLQGLDAFSRQLKRFDIKVSGNNSDTVEKFFSNYNTAVLFPEYIRKCVQAGIDENNLVQDIIANTIDSNSLDYRSVYVKQDDNHSSISISTYDNLVPIHKHGRLLNASYEALRFQRISTLTVLLKQIGCHIAKCQYHDAVNILSDNHYTVCKTFENIPYDIAVWLNVLNGYKLTTVLCSLAGFKLLQEPLNDMIVYRDNGNYYRETKIIVSPNDPPCRIIGIDNRYALEMIKCGSVKMDYEKLIDRQFERAEIYSIAGFSAMCTDAIKSIKW